MSDTTMMEKPAYTPPAVNPIASDDDYVAYAGDLKTIKAYVKKVEEFYGPRKARTRALWQSEIDDEKAALKPALDTEAQIKAELVAWDDKKEAERIEEQKRLDAEALKREEQRVLDEAAALEREAERTGDEDLREQARQIMEEPIEAPTTMLAKSTPKVAGLNFRKTWSAEVTNMAKLIQFVAKNPTYANLLLPNLPALNKLATSMDGKMPVDGVIARSKKGAASGR